MSGGWHLRRRAAINALNAIVLSRLNGSVVASGFPKSGTTFLSHALEAMTGLRYLEGSRELAIRASVIHCHFRAVPAKAIFSYRPLTQVVPSYVAHLLAYDRQDVLERLRNNAETGDDRALLEQLAQRILSGHRRLPSPANYYIELAARGARILDLPRLTASNTDEEARLARWLGLDRDAVRSGIAQARALSEDRRTEGHSFYNRPSERITSLLGSNLSLAAEIGTQAEQAASALRRTSGSRHD